MRMTTLCVVLMDRCDKLFSLLRIIHPLQDIFLRLLAKQ